MPSEQYIQTHIRTEYICIYMHISKMVSFSKAKYQVMIFPHSAFLLQPSIATQRTTTAASSSRSTPHSIRMVLRMLHSGRTHFTTTLILTTCPKKDTRTPLDPHPPMCTRPRAGVQPPLSIMAGEFQRSPSSDDVFAHMCNSFCLCSHTVSLNFNSFSSCAATIVCHHDPDVCAITVLL